MRLTHNCPTCGKPAEIQAEIPMGEIITKVYKCGHLELIRKIEVLKPREERDALAVEEGTTSPPVMTSTANGFHSVTGLKECYTFQREGVEFAEGAQLKCLIADAMGLGKTIQSLTALKRNYRLMSPCLMIVKGSTIFQWAREFKDWVTNKPLGIMPVISRVNLMPGFENYIISMDLIGRPGILEKLIALGFKSIIVDECHSFKDESSARTRALVKLIKGLNNPRILMLSGTPIKNRADEYFVPLNILAPEYFSSKLQFQRNWLIQDEKGRYTRIAPWRLDAFRTLISKWVIRREKHDVLTNLPSFKMDYVFVEIEDENIKNSYNNELRLFDNFLHNTARITSQDILGWLAKLRAITGAAKCQPALDWAVEFLDSTDENLAIGIQHRQVRDTLFYVFEGAGYSPLKFSGEDSKYRKDEVLRQFNSGEKRLLIINEIAGGYGLNLQCCANFLTVEQQWNEADMDQFAGRFHRDGQVKAVNGTEMLARGTIDEFFYDLRMKKKQIFGETVQGWSFTEDIEGMRELSERIIENRLK